MYRVWKQISANWIAIWLIIAIIGTISFVSYAEYIEDKNRVKRVAANMTEEGQPFSSNYLMADDTPVKTIYFPADTENWCGISVKIWNYNHANAAKAYQGSLNYKLKAQLVNSAGTLIASGTLGSNNIGIRKGSEGEFTNFSEYQENLGYYLEFSDSFTGDANGYVPTEHIFELRFPASMLTNNPGIYIKLEAVPDNLADLSPISSIIGVAAQGTAISLGWNGRFDDDTAYSDYDGLNYAISGNGTATLTFKWRTDRLEVNRYNLSDYNLTPKTEVRDGVTWKYVTISADSNVRNRYDFQLYMTDRTDADYVTMENDFWKTAESFIIFSAE